MSLPQEYHCTNKHGQDTIKKVFEKVKIALAKP